MTNCWMVSILVLFRDVSGFKMQCLNLRNLLVLQAGLIVGLTRKHPITEYNLLYNVVIIRAFKKESNKHPLKKAPVITTKRPLTNITFSLESHSAFSAFQE